MNYTEFRNQIFQRYAHQDFDGALALIHAEAGRFPEHAVRILYWQACIAGLAGRPDAALHSLQTLVERGLWYDPELVRTDSDLAILHGRPEFEAVLAAFTARQVEARRLARPELVVLAPPETTARPYPVVIAIHGRNDNAHSFAEYWQSLVEQGWLVALPQSSMIFGSESYGWDDRGQAEAELTAHLDRLCEEYPIDSQRIVLAGFSQGGGLSLWMALNGRIPATGFLAFVPYLHGIESMELTPAPAPGLHGWIFTGDQDPHQEMFAHMTALLERAGVTFERRRYPSIAHEMPPDFAQVIPAALAALFPGKMGGNTRPAGAD